MQWMEARTSPSFAGHSPTSPPSLPFLPSLPFFPSSPVLMNNGVRLFKFLLSVLLGFLSACLHTADVPPVLQDVVEDVQAELFAEVLADADGGAGPPPPRE